MVTIVALPTLSLISTADSYASGSLLTGEKPIVSVFAKLGLADGCEIVTADRPDIVENTAAVVLQQFLGKGGLQVRIVTESKSTGKKRFLLGQESNLRAIKDFGDK